MHGELVSKDAGQLLNMPHSEQNTEKGSTESTSFDTVDILKDLGFKPDSSVLSNKNHGLSFDFGNLKLSAATLLNRYFVEVVLVWGVWSTPSELGEIEIQLPLKVISLEQCCAFITWGLDNHIGRKFFSDKPTYWLDIGRKNLDTLPWIREEKLYETRPKCLVDKDWLRLALRDLGIMLQELKDEDILTVTFQDGILSIRSNIKLIALPATGDNWKYCYQILASSFWKIPKRLGSQNFEISVWMDCFRVVNYGYPIHKKIELV